MVATATLPLHHLKNLEFSAWCFSKNMMKTPTFLIEKES
jgi:hypothetical protein